VVASDITNDVIPICRPEEDDMQVNATAAEHPGEPLYLRVAWLCGVVLSLEGYDIAEVGYAIPSLVDAWHVGPSAFTRVLTAGNIGLLLGSLIPDCWAIDWGEGRC